MHTSRITRGVGAAMLLVVVGGTSATAMSYGSQSAPMKVSNGGIVRGYGYGTFTAVGYDGAQLTATLRDTRKDDTRTYAQGSAYGNNDYVKTTSGQRADGEDWFAPMQTKTNYSAGPIGHWNAEVKLCQARTGLDWCTEETTAKGRL